MSEDSKRKWRCALLLVGEGQEYQESAAEGLLSAHPEEVAVIVPRLKPYQEETIDFFTRTIFEERHPERGIRAVCAMAKRLKGTPGEQRRSNGKRLIHHPSMVIGALSCL